ncbi:MAG: DUF5615 family PIN-like protein [Verrucomicrobiota bacterium]
MKLLLDVHVPAAVARELRQRSRGLSVAHLSEWRVGQFLAATDEEILAAAQEEKWTLVTYDLKTIAPLLRRLADEEIAHSGVVLVDDSSIRQSDVGGLVNALARLWKHAGQTDWGNRAHFLQSVKRPN